MRKLFLLAFIVNCSVIDAASPIGGEEVVSAALSGDVDVVALDVDRDYDVDIFGTSGGDGDVFWWEQQGSGVWVEHVIDNSFPGGSRIYLADLDNDGDEDVIVLSQSGGIASWWPNAAGDGSLWSAESTVATGTEPKSAATGDFDRDGDLDIAIAFAGDNSVTWFENGNSWAAHVVESSFNGVSEICQGDMDNDGDLDLIGASPALGIVRWWENDGSGGGWTDNDVSISFAGAAHIQLLDADSDGDLDIAGTSETLTTGGFRLFLGSAKGTAWNASTIAGDVRNCNRIRIADYDRDSQPDIMTAHTSGLNASVLMFWENLGSGSAWSGEELAGNVTGYLSLGIEDTDGDGDYELFGNRVSDRRVVLRENLTIHRNIDFLESHRAAISTPNQYLSTDSGDIDNDGDIDFVVSDASTSVYLYENLGSISSWQQHTLFNEVAVVRYARFADVDQDGDLDIITNTYSPGNVTVWRNPGLISGTWNDTVIVSGYPTAIIDSGDIDGDGDIDVAVGGSSNRWYRNDDSAGTAWTPMSQFVTGATTNDIMLYDYSRDGNLDILYSTDGYYRWNLNGGGGSSWANGPTGSRVSVRQVDAGDIDNDGDTDTIAASRFQLYWGENDGTLAASPDQTTYTIDTISTSHEGYQAVHLADLDSDGDLDVLLGTQEVVSSGRLWWYENDGTPQNGGWVKHYQNDSNLWGITHLESGDFDSDGDLDIVVGSSYTNTLFIYENLGGQFRFLTTDNAPSFVSEGEQTNFLTIDVTHNGRLGDNSLELSSLHLLLEKQADFPLLSGSPQDEANDLIERLLVYTDDGSGSFEEDQDTVITTLETLVLDDGEFFVNLPDQDPLVAVHATETRRFFVVLELAPDAASQSVSQFLITHLSESGSRAEDRDYDQSLIMQYSPDTPSTRVTIDSRPTVLLDTAATDPTEDSPISVGITFSESVSGLTEGDFLVSNGVATNLQGTGSVYTIDVVPSGEGAISVQLPYGSAIDSVGLESSESNLLERTYDTGPPVFAGIDSVSPGDTLFDAFWLPASDPSIPITYNVYVANGSGLQNFSSPAVSTQDLSATVSGLANDTVYYVVVRAEDAGGKEETNVVEIAVKPRSELFNLSVEGRLDEQYLSGLYSGGSDFARPALGDLDGDNDMDMIIGRRDGTFSYWENLGSGDSATWAAPVHNYESLAVSEYGAPALGDIDGDGDRDLVVGSSDGTLTLFRNVGTRTSPAWSVPENNFAGVDVLVYALPALGDLDSDGDSDLVVGSIDGTLAYYQNLGGGSWAGEVVLYGNVAVTALSAPNLVDVDGDGDLDLLVGDVTGALTYVENTGDTAEAAWGESPILNWLGIDAGLDASPAAVLRAGDGLVDLFIGSRIGEVTSYVVSPTAIKSTPRSFSMIDIGSRSVPAFGDIDGDGDTDLLVGGADGRLAYYENTGTPTVALWKSPFSYFASIDVGSFASPVIEDLNGDGLADLVIGSRDGEVRYYQRTASRNSSADFTLVTTNLGGLAAGSYTVPLLIDTGDDGLVDLIVGYGDGTLGFARNIGSPSTPAWTPAVFGYLGLDFGENASPGAGDLDDDGLIDLMVGDSTGRVAAIFNEGSSSTPEFTGLRTEYSGIDVGLYSAPRLVDLDGDGDFDLFSGEEDGGLNSWKNMNEHVRLSPRTQTGLIGESVFIKALDVGGTPNLAWSLVRNESGGAFTIIDDTTIRYDVGPVGGPNITDVVEVIDNASGLFGRSYINAISSEDAGAAGKAIICAGWRNSGDAVWPATRTLSSLAYRVLLSRGLDKQDIYFLSPDLALDADGDGDAGNDVDALSTSANLENAIRNWALGAGELTLYMVDHGFRAFDEGRFILGDTSDVVGAPELDGWLDDLQLSGDLDVNVIIDCCNSGAFLPYLKAPNGKQRFVATSCGPDELTYFVGSGQISFSEAFWNSIYTGSTMGQAFSLAKASMQRYQTSLFDDNSDGLFEPGIDEGPDSEAWDRYLGLEWIAGADRPQIGLVSSNIALQAGETETEIFAAEVSGGYAIDRVWAIVVPPSFNPDPTISDPVVTLPEVELAFNPAENRWEAMIGGFTETGSYKIILYCQDVWESVSFPKQVYVQKTDLNEKAIVAIADSSYDPSAATPLYVNWYLGDLAYSTLRNRGFDPDRIQYLSDETPAADVDLPVSEANLSDSISTWAGDVDQLTLYIVGQGSEDQIRLNSTDVITALELDLLLDAYQNVFNAQVVVILESINSGSFLDDLDPPAGKERIVLASSLSGGQSYALAGGVLSFSHPLFSSVLEGVNLRDAYIRARSTVRFWSQFAQQSSYSDNPVNSLTRDTFIGAAFLTGGDDLPAIGQVMPDQSVTPGVEIALWCADVFDSDGIERVEAFVVPQAPLDPNSTVAIELSYDSGSDRWTGNHIFGSVGGYSICFVAIDDLGNTSIPIQSTISTGGDPYEIDDSPEQAKEYLISDDPGVDDLQYRTIQDPGDEDWIKFYVRDDISGSVPYTLNISGVTGGSDLVVELYREGSPLTLLGLVDDNAANSAESFAYNFTIPGLHYWRIRDVDPVFSGGSYTLQLTENSGANNGLASGTGTTQMSVSWLPSVSLAPNGFDVESTSTPTDTGSWAIVNGAPVPNSQVDQNGFVKFEHTNLTPDTRYYYRVLIRTTSESKFYWTGVFSGVTQEFSDLDDWKDMN